MRFLASRLCIALAAALVVASGAFTPAHAQWMDVATISSTLGNTLNRLCVGGGRTDFGCPADAPLLDTSINRLTVPTDLRVMGNLLVSGSQQFDGVTFANGGVSATGTISATSFSGDGSGITGIDFSANPIDRIISGTAAVIAQQGGTVGLTLGGIANAAYFHPTLGFVGPGVSVTGPISGTHGYFGGNVGIGTLTPQARLDVNGDIRATNLRVSGNLYVSGSQTIDGVSFANGGVSATGTITATSFVGNGSGLTGIDFAANPTDRIISGTAAVIAQNAGTVSFTLAGTPGAAYMHPTLGFVGPGVSTTGPISATVAYVGLLRAGERTPLNPAITGYSTAAMFAVNNNSHGGIEVRNRSNGASAEGRVVLSDDNGASGHYVTFSMPSSGNTQTMFGLQRQNLALLLSGNGSSGSGAGRTLGIGTATANHVILGTDSVERMRITSTGLVGIGTAVPSSTLHINGTLRIANGAETCDVHRTGAIKYQNSAFYVCQNGSAWEQMATTTSNTLVSINTGLSGSIVFRDDYGYLKARDSFSISSTTGSVGIGAGAPAWLGNNGLYVDGGMYASGYIVENGNRLAWGDNSTYVQGSTTANNQHFFMAVGGSEAMRIVSTGLVGIGTSEPTAALHVSGTLRLSNGAEACDADRTGAIRFEVGQFKICRNGTTWENLVAGGSGSVDTDRITSSTTAGVIANQSGGTVSFTLGSTSGAAYLHPTLGLVAPGVSATGAISGTRGYFSGNVGVGLAATGNALTVSGTISTTMVTLGTNGSSCTAADRGTIKFENNKMYMCRD